jgi:outer membrane protein insertion porin family
MRRAVLLVVLVSSTALGQESERPPGEPKPPPADAPEVGEQRPEGELPPAPEPEASPAPAPGGIGEALTPSAEQLGLEFLFGAVATCRTGAYGVDPLLGEVSVAGELLESNADVRAMFDAAVSWTKKGRWYSEENCRKLRELGAKLRYRVELEEALTGGTVALRVVLRPITQVRSIQVHGNASLWPWQWSLSPVFREDVIRRMKLRPGGSLDDDADRRRAQLADEEQRVREYLSRRGYYDATVKVSEVEEGPYEVTLRVDIDKGPGYTVGKVTVEGNSAVEDEIITEIMSQRVCPFAGMCLWKDRFDYEELKTDRARVREIYQERGYPGVRVNTTYNPSESPDHGSKTVRFTVLIEERKKLTLAFEGARARSDKDLRSLLTFDEAGAYDDFEAQNGAEAIRRSYQGSGRFTTTVSFERVKLAPTADCPQCAPHDAITYHIDEGPEQRVRSIDFRGNRTFADEILTDVIATRVFPRFQYLFGAGGYVTSLSLSQDVERLGAFYQQQGFPEARIVPHIGNRPGIAAEIGAVAAQVTAEDRGSGLHLVYDIVEGPRDVVSAVEIAGNHELSADELAEGASIVVGQPYTRQAMDSDVERIKRRYVDRGYLYVAVAPERLGAGAATRVRFVISEGIQVRAGKVIVRGTFKTRRWVVKDALGLKEGEVLSVARLEESQAGLRSTDLFANVRPSQLVGRDPVHLIVDVEERFDRILDGRVAAGYSSDNNVFVAGSLELPHLGGIGVSLNLNGEVGLERQRAQATLAFPIWVMRRVAALPMRLELQGRLRNDDTPRFGTLSTKGVSVTLSRQLSPGVLFSLRYDWNRFGRQTDLLRPPGPNAGEELDEAPINTTTASLGPVILIDRRRPTALMPTHGFTAQAQFQWASTALLGTDDFFKLGLAGQFFVPIGSRLVMMNTVRYDQGFPLRGAVLLPEVERFTAGGDTTVRGIDQDRLATEIIANPLLPASDITGFRLVPVGGNIRFIHKLDLQVRLIGGDVAVASALFLDTGFITNSFFRFDAGHRFRHSLGMALVRLMSPVGSLSFEYAFPLDPELGDDPTGRWHINIGFAL